MAASRAAAAAAAAGVAAAAAAYHFKDDAPPLHSALQPGRQLVCPLVAKTPLTADTSRYRFALPTPAHSLGLPVASHVLAVDAGNMYREYTPVTLDGVDVGYFDLVVKRYANGYFSEQFARLEPGQTMRFSGPVVTLPYAANAADCVAMVAGGTGITPMLQIARASLRDDGDATKFALLYANRTPGDILLRAELDALAAAHPDRFSVRYVVDETDGRADVDAVGRVDAAQVARFLPPASAPRTLVLVCGPKGFVAHLCGARARPGGPVGGLLGALGYDRVVPFG